MKTPASREKLAAIAAAFPLPGAFLGGEPYGSGHINDTYAVAFNQAGARVRYILQRINRRIFAEVPALMENIRRVTTHAAKRADESGHPDAIRRALRLVPSHGGAPYHVDGEGEFWRCYLFIERARTYDLIETPAQAAAAAGAFAHFQMLLVDLPGGRLHETIPNFHHTRSRYGRLIRAIDAAPRDRVDAARFVIDFAHQREAIVDTLLRLHASGALPERVTHNDTKLNNVMLDEATGAALCVIDLDTVMPGLALYDFGDMVRSATNSTAEDDPDPGRITARLDIFAALVAGYVGVASAFLTETELAHLVFSGRLITFESGIRFLTDYLEGDVYYKTKYPGHNLDRARNQFALVRSIEEQQPAMDAIVKQHATSACMP